MNAARSRASMNCSEREGGSGTTATSGALAEEMRMHETGDPVAETIGRIVRTDDQSRPHDERTIAEDCP